MPLRFSYNFKQTDVNKWFKLLSLDLWISPIRERSHGCGCIFPASPCSIQSIIDGGAGRGALPIGSARRKHACIMLARAYHMSTHMYTSFDFVRNLPDWVAYQIRAVIRRLLPHTYIQRKALHAPFDRLSCGVKMPCAVRVQPPFSLSQPFNGQSDQLYVCDLD